MSTLNQESAVKILNNKKVISAPGTYELQVSSVTPFTREDGNNVTIVNFKAITNGHLQGWVDPETGEQVSGIIQLLKEEKFDDACNLGVSSSQRATDFTPSKGEFCKVRMENRTTKSGVTGLFVVAVSPVEIKAAASMDFGKLFATEAEAPAEANVDAETANV